MYHEYLNPIGCLNILIELGIALEGIDNIKELLKDKKNKKSFCKEMPQNSEIVTPELIGNTILKIGENQFSIKEITDVLDESVYIEPKKKRIQTPKGSWTPLVTLIRFSNGTILDERNDD